MKDPNRVKPLLEMIIGKKIRKIEIITIRMVKGGIYILSIWYASGIHQ